MGLLNQNMAVLSPYFHIEVGLDTNYCVMLILVDGLDT